MTRIRQFLAAFLLVTLLGAVFDQAYAATETLDSVRLTPLVVSVLISFVLPLLTGLLSRASWSAGAKGLMTLILTAVQTVVVQNTVEDGGAFFSQEVLIAFALSLAISITSYVGVYKPLKLTSSPVVVVDPERQMQRLEPGKLANVGLK